MKKILLGLSLLLASSATFSQVSFGIKAGANFVQIPTSVENVSFKSDNLTAFNAGIFLDCKLGSVSIQPGVNFTQKGGKFNAESNVDVDGSSSVTLNYVQIPVSVLYHIPVVVGDVYFGPGVYASGALSGHTKSKFGDGSSESHKITFEEADGDFKRSDYGVLATVGFKFKMGFLVNFNYDWGLQNISNDNTAKTKSRAMGVSVGYAF